ncbi:MAG TPA: hypothetical protein VGA37_10550 [Gemmatimonadales bacterium]
MKSWLKTGVPLPNVNRDPVSGIVIVSPGFPESAGGVTDHTARLVVSWEASGIPVRVFAGPSGDPRSLATEWRAAGVAAVLLQYVPFLYGRRGLSRFPEQLARAAASTRIRVTVFVHEPWVPPTRPVWWLLSPQQRRQLRRLVACANCTVTAVPAWASGLGGHVDIVYVGATMTAADAPTAPPLQSPVVFSPTAAGLAWDWIESAALAIGASPHLILIGGDPADDRIPRTLELDRRGHLPAQAAVGLLGSAPLVLAPFTDGLTGRRTSVMAALRVGARVVSSAGDLYDPLFDDSPVTIARSKEAFAALAAERWRAGDDGGRSERIAWYQRHFDHQRLDRRLAALVLGDSDE